MTEWKFASAEKAEELARVEYFSMKKTEAGRVIEFLITVREYVSPPDPAMRFYAVADKQTNQAVAPFTPCGWGPELLIALNECLKAVRRFPYQGD